MVVYWSIKSTFDLVRYGLGQTDKFKGTGVWSFIELNKKPSSDNEEVTMTENKNKTVNDSEE